jgi:hypothetical protein
MQPSAIRERAIPALKQPKREEGQTALSEALQSQRKQRKEPKERKQPKQRKH